MAGRKFEDDGRRIADMSGTDIPVFDAGIWERFRERKRKRVPDPAEPVAPPLSRRETWSLIAGAMGAAFLVAMIFIAAACAFILFCIFVWFR